MCRGRQGRPCPAPRSGPSWAAEGKGFPAPCTGNESPARQGLGKPTICLQPAPAVFQPPLPNETSHTGSPELPGCPSPPPPEKSRNNKLSACREPTRPLYRGPRRPAPLPLSPLCDGARSGPAPGRAGLALAKPWHPLPAPARPLFIAGEAPRGPPLPTRRPAHHPRERPAQLPVRATRRQLAGSARRVAFAFARPLAAPAGRRGSPGARRRASLGPRPPLRAAHLALCGRRRGQGAPRPSSRRLPPPGARETAARGLPAAPGGPGAGRGAAVEPARRTEQSSESGETAERREGGSQPRPRASSYPPATPWHLCTELGRAPGHGAEARSLAHGGPGRGGRAGRGAGARSLAA